MAEAWYVARIKTTISWDVVISNLARQNFSSYIPITKSATYFGGRKTIIEQPLFPAYIFILLDLETMRWRAVNSTVGIVYMLPARAEIPLPVPSVFINEIRSRKTTSQMIAVTKRFLADELVRFIAGPLAESAEPRLGKVLTSTEHATRLAVPVLGRETVVTVPTDQLSLA